MKFQIMMDQIRQYVIRHTDDDWKRSLVCGILWMPNAIAVSTRRLRRLMGKCKSSINHGFQSIGYETATMTSSHATELTRAFPALGRTCGEIRQWTIRAPIAVSPPEMQAQLPYAHTEMSRIELHELMQLIEDPAGFVGESDDLPSSCEGDRLGFTIEYDS
jgi:hypothetical protein